jgi:hypothetical protein
MLLLLVLPLLWHWSRLLPSWAGSWRRWGWWWVPDLWAQTLVALLLTHLRSSLLLTCLRYTSLLLIMWLQLHWWLVFQVSQQLLILLPAGSSCRSRRLLLAAAHLGAKVGGADDAGAGTAVLTHALLQLRCLSRVACLPVWSRC